MQKTIAIPLQKSSWRKTIVKNIVVPSAAQQPGRVEKYMVNIGKQLNLFFIACITIKKPSLIIKVFKQLIQLRKNTWGTPVNKMYKVDRLYFDNLYTPGWPSLAYNNYIKDELLRHAFPLDYAGKLSVVFFAITRKCPMRCDHCFEWDNLNKKETFSKNQLLQIVDIYQSQGALQMHFSGGEPMTRIHDLVDLISHAKNKSECFVVTSGFNVTAINAQLLKQAGCKGIVVSIDHYIPELHNSFRHYENIFQQAVDAVQAALNAGLVTTISVCVTKTFLDGGHLLPYLQFAKNLGVHFVQLLEPKSIGHYADKDVLLEEKHMQLLETFFKTINHSTEFKDYPFVLYHGYHQRRVGCYAGSRSIYIDSAGDVNACPFCHTKSYNVGDILKSKSKQAPVKENLCPRYGKIA